MRLLHRCVIATTLLTAALATGCVVATDDDPVAVVEPAEPTSGTLVVRWTIDGLSDANECAKSVSTEIEIRVHDTNQREIGAWRQTCSEFETTIPLTAGSYAASAVLLDASGRPRTTAVTIQPFTLRGNDVLDVPVDFPNTSFF